MRISSLIIRNFRCIGEMNIDVFSPITILVGRNNTGKSAFIEALALASSASVGWYDALGEDLLGEIVERRGGFDYSNLMIKVGKHEANILPKGRNISGTIKIVDQIEKLPDEARSSVLASVEDYIENAYDSYMYPEVLPEELERRPPRVSTKERERRRIRQINLARRKGLRGIKACVAYYDVPKRRPVTAALVGDVSPATYESDIYEILPVQEIVRSTSPGEGKTLLAYSPNIEFITELQRRLAKSGRLANLIRSLRKEVHYFQDIREVDEDFLVSVKGLDAPVPLQSMGDGFSANISLIAAIEIARGGIVLMEEPESKLHPGFMNLVASQIIKSASKGNAQHVISTHSLDFLEFLLEESAELVSVVRMYRVEEEAGIDYEVLSGIEALQKRKDLKMDLRGI